MWGRTRRVMAVVAVTLMSMSFCTRSSGRLVRYSACSYEMPTLLTWRTRRQGECATQGGAMRRRRTRTPIWPAMGFSCAPMCSYTLSLVSEKSAWMTCVSTPCAALMASALASRRSLEREMRTMFIFLRASSCAYAAGPRFRRHMPLSTHRCGGAGRSGAAGRAPSPIPSVAPVTTAHLP